MSKLIKSSQIIHCPPCQLTPVELKLPEIEIQEEELTPEVLPDFPLEETVAEENVIADIPQISLEDLEREKERILAAVAAEVRTILEQAKNTASQTAEKLLQEATEKGEACLAAAREEGEQLKTAAREEGLAEGRLEGLAAGREQARAEYVQQLQNALETLNQAETLRTQRLLDSEPELLKLAVAIGEKLVAAELQQNPSSIRGMVAHALQKVAGAAKIKVKVNSEDLEELQAVSKREFEAVLNEPKPIKFEVDPEFERGDCYITTELGNVDARMQTQLEQILAQLLKVGQL